MPTISNRAAVKAQIVDVLAAAAVAAAAEDAPDPRLAGVVIFYSDAPQGYDDPDLDPDEAVVIGSISGDQEAVTISSSATGRNDVYKIECFIGVRSSDTVGDTMRAVDARCQQIIDAIGAELFAGVRLDRAPNPMNTDGIYPGRLDGPNASPTNGTAVLSGAYFDIEISAALRGS